MWKKSFQWLIFAYLHIYLCTITSHCHIFITRCILFVEHYELTILIVFNSLAVELSFGQKFKSDPRIEQIRQLNPRVELLEFEEIEFVTYKFLELEQKLLFKFESWTKILVQPEDWIESDCPSCSKLNFAITLVFKKKWWFIAIRRK